MPKVDFLNFLNTINMIDLTLQAWFCSVVARVHTRLVIKRLWVRISAHTISTFFSFLQNFSKFLKKLFLLYEMFDEETHLVFTNLGSEMPK